MRTIWKFEVPVADEVEVEMPRHAEILDVKPLSSDRLNLWAIVDDAFTTAPRRFSIRGTGHPLREVGKYLATASDGRFVWHVFEAAT